MRKYLFAFVMGLLVVAQSLFAQDFISGKKHPEQIPANVALSQFLRAFSEPAGAHSKHFSGMVGKVGLSKEGTLTLASTLESFAGSHKAIIAHQKDATDDMVYWTPLIALVQNTTLALNASLSPSDRTKFWAFIENEKAGMSISTTDPQLGAVAMERRKERTMVASAHAMAMPDGDGMNANYSSYTTSYFSIGSSPSNSSIVLYYAVSGTTNCPFGCPPQGLHTAYAGITINGNNFTVQSQPSPPANYIQVSVSNNIMPGPQSTVTVVGSVACNILGTGFWSDSSFNGYAELAFTYIKSTHNVIGTWNTSEGQMKIYGAQSCCFGATSTVSPCLPYAGVPQADNNVNSFADEYDPVDPGGYMVMAGCGRFSSTPGTLWHCSTQFQGYLWFPVSVRVPWASASSHPYHVCTRYDSGDIDGAWPVPWSLLMTALEDE